MKTFLLIAAALFLAPTFASGQCTTTFETESLGAFFVGQPANFQIQGVSGTPPYRYELVDSVLPEGLHLTASGKIVGVPRVEGDSTVFIRLTDAEGCGLVQAFVVQVFPEGGPA